MFGGDWADVRGPRGDPPGCGPCKRERETIVDMEPETAHRPGVLIDVWRCPECGTEVVRGDGNERFV